MNTCPTCAGPQMVDHPCGVLMVRHTNDCPVRASEDARQVADKDTGRARFTRPATETERVLLAAFGYVVPDELLTQVDFLTAGARRREWPGLNLAADEVTA